MTKLEELLSHITGPVIKGRPKYDLHSCLECLSDKDLQWMLKMYRDEQSSNTDYHFNPSHPAVDNTFYGSDAADHMSYADLIDILAAYITNPETVSLMIKAEEMAGVHFIQSTVVAIGRADDLWTKNTASGLPEKIREIEQLKQELHNLDTESHTYYQQYEGQFKTDAEYEADRKQHYAEIDKKIAVCNKRLEELGYRRTEKTIDEPAEVSLVMNSEVDAHFCLLQRAGLIYLFTDWDGRGRESGYHFDLDLNWSELPKRERDDPWSSIYNIGRAPYHSRHLHDRLIGAQPFRPRQVIREGKRVWTIEPPRGKIAPTAEDDVCLRLVMPVEVQRIVWNTLIEM